MPGSPPALLEGRHLRLEPLLPEHYPAIHRLVVSRAEAVLWRSRGRWIPSGHLERFLAEGVALTAVAVDRDRPVVRGFVELLHVDKEARHGEVSMFWPDGDGFAFEALELFCDEVFVRFVLGMEARLGREFPEALWRSLRTVGDVVALGDTG
jgi:hypothetical protein